MAKNSWRNFQKVLTGPLSFLAAFQTIGKKSLWLDKRGSDEHLINKQKPKLQTQ